jgi:hypothetical protein
VRAPNLAEKDLRSLLKRRKLSLSRITLPEALDAFLAFYRDVRDYEVVAEGDGVVAYVDVTDYGRGTRYEFGFNRLLRLPQASTSLGNHRLPALRLRLRLCFKWDMEVVQDLLPDGTWSGCGWSVEEVDELAAMVRESKRYQVMAAKDPSEATVALEHTTYRPTEIRPPADTRQMWWGVLDVA